MKLEIHTCKMELPDTLIIVEGDQRDLERGGPWTLDLGPLTSITYMISGNLWEPQNLWGGAERDRWGLRG